MCYLEEKAVVHRDLAARNVLCNQNGIIKISDYGLAETCPFVMKSAGKLPFHILAPECLQEKHIFTFFSDVWAFGVLLWDIFNLCREEPYKKWNVTDAETLLKLFSSGRRLDIPKYATKTLHEVMLACWSFDPDRRLGFSKCRQRMAMELERCAPGSVDELQKKLSDEISSVMKDELNKLNTLLKQRHPDVKLQLLCLR